MSARRWPYYDLKVGEWFVVEKPPKRFGERVRQCERQSISGFAGAQRLDQSSENEVTEQRTPDALSMQAENELICEKLLGWEPARVRGDGTVERWHIGTGPDYRSSTTPSFTTWADAGLILEALAKISEWQVGYCSTDECWYCEPTNDSGYSDGATGPLAIRAAALEFLETPHDDF